MALQLIPESPVKKIVLKDEVQLSYFAKRREKTLSHIAYAKLLDISNAGLCMEISPDDSQLYMETGGQLFLLNRTIELQIFCRSCTSNVSIEGHVKWIKQASESDALEENGGICVGVLFNFDNAEQRRDLAELIGLLKTDTISCGECGSPASAEAALCFNCGAKLVRRRAFFKKIINNLLASGKSSSSG